jgi:hypothetical protein
LEEIVKTANLSEMGNQEFVDLLLRGKSLKQQVAILKDCLVEQVLSHPWLDDELHDSIMESITRAYKVPVRVAKNA